MSELRVEDEHRANELSVIPGGSDVKAFYRDGKVLIYDKIKNVKKYCSVLITRPEVIEIWVDGKPYWKR